MPSESIGSDIEPLMLASAANFFLNLGPSGISDAVATDVAENVGPGLVARPRTSVAHVIP